MRRGVKRSEHKDTSEQPLPAEVLYSLKMQKEGATEPHPPFALSNYER